MTEAIPTIKPTTIPNIRHFPTSDRCKVRFRGESKTKRLIGSFAK